jgi:hypothetical protein
MKEVNSDRAHAVLSAADRATGVTNAEGVGDGARFGTVDVQPARASAKVRKTLT